MLPTFDGPSQVLVNYRTVMACHDLGAFSSWSLPESILNLGQWMLEVAERTPEAKRKKEHPQLSARGHFCKGWYRKTLIESSERDIRVWRLESDKPGFESWLLSVLFTRSLCFFESGFLINKMGKEIIPYLMRLL